MALGDRINKLRVPWLGKRVAESAGTEGRFWGGAVRAVVRHPAVSLVASVALLLLATAPVLGLKLGASGPSSLPDDAPGKQGLIALERDFATGATEPVEIVDRHPRRTCSSTTSSRAFAASSRRTPTSPPRAPSSRRARTSSLSRWR